MKKIKVSCGNCTTRKCSSEKYCCPRCGSEARKLGAGKAPGGASLLCAGCKKFIKWIAAGEEAIAAQLNMNQGGC